MEKFKDTIITNAGRKLLIKVGAGEGMITYTKAVLYQQDVNSMQDEDIRNLTTLTGEKQTANVTVTPPEDNTVTVATAFSNKDLKDDVTFNTIGWWAKNSIDRKEILLGISPSYKEQTLAAGSPDGRSTASIELTLNMAISNAAKVDLTVNEIGVAHISDVNAAIERLKAEYDPKIAEAGKVKGARINNGQVVNPDDKGILNLTVESADDVKNLVQSSINNALDGKVNVSDFNALNGKVNNLDGSKTLDAPNFDTVTDTGVYLVTNSNKGKDYPKNVTSKGVLIVQTGVDPETNKPSVIEQRYVDSELNTINTRVAEDLGPNLMWQVWQKVSRDEDVQRNQMEISNLKYSLSDFQSQVNSLKTQLSDAVNTINYLKQNMVIGRHFSDDKSAQSWYNANPNGIAFIDK